MTMVPPDSAAARDAWFDADDDNLELFTAEEAGTGDAKTGAGADVDPLADFACEDPLEELLRPGPVLSSPPEPPAYLPLPRSEYLPTPPSTMERIVAVAAAGAARLTGRHLAAAIGVVGLLVSSTYATRATRVREAEPPAIAHLAVQEPAPLPSEPVALTDALRDMTSSYSVTPALPGVPAEVTAPAPTESSTDSWNISPASRASAAPVARLSEPPVRESSAVAVSAPPTSRSDSRALSSAPQPPRAAAVTVSLPALPNIPVAVAGEGSVPRATSPAPIETPRTVESSPAIETAMERLLPRVERVAAAEAPLPAAAPEVETASVRTVLGRYATALSSLDVDATIAVWPAVDAKGLARAFDRLQEQKVTFSDCQISLTAPRAEAVCRGQDQYVPNIGNKTPRNESHRWTFTLRKSEGAWVIESVTSK